MNIEELAIKAGVIVVDDGSTFWAGNNAIEVLDKFAELVLGMGASITAELKARQAQAVIEGAQAYREFGATHYLPQGDGVSIAMLYKQKTERFNDGTERIWWHYLSYANIWLGTGVPTAELEAQLIAIQVD